MLKLVILVDEHNGPDGLGCNLIPEAHGIFLVAEVIANVTVETKPITIKHLFKILILANDNNLLVGKHDGCYSLNHKLCWRITNRVVEATTCERIPVVHL